MASAEQDRAGQGAFGILLIYKPAGPTSHDVVGWVRWALRERTTVPKRKRYVTTGAGR